MTVSRTSFDPDRCHVQKALGGSKLQSLLSEVRDVAVVVADWSLHGVLETPTCLLTEAKQTPAIRTPANLTEPLVYLTTGRHTHTNLGRYPIQNPQILKKERERERERKQCPQILQLHLDVSIGGFACQTIGAFRAQSPQSHGDIISSGSPQGLHRGCALIVSAPITTPAHR